ncbi:MAG: type II-A CRISPR-associated protein Csn2 [Sphaerochaetaceae bacterium]|nr:type II-A CRISPR-associated protein Csn2 [Sphaerochaetaceae bacterium]
MKLIHPTWEHTIQFQENVTTTLIIENASAMRSYISELSMSIETNEGPFILSDQQGMLSLSDHLIIITDIFHLSFDQKKITTKLNSELKALLVSETCFEEAGILSSKLLDFAGTLEQLLPYPLCHTDTIDLGSLLKLLAFQCRSNQETLIEKIVDYMKILHDLCGISCFIFVNLKTLFTSNELESFIQTCFLEKHHILFIESTVRKKCRKEEIYVIIDNDLCEVF